MNENTFEMGEYEIEAVILSKNDLWTLELVDGRSFDFAPNHRFYLGEELGFVELQNLKTGQIICGDTPGVVSSTKFKEADAEVVKIMVKGAHTYQTSGLISHNTKVSNEIPN